MLTDLHKMIEPHTDLKHQLVEEIKREEWRKHIEPEKYAKDSAIFEELRKRNLEIIQAQNQAFDVDKIKIKTKKCPNLQNTVSAAARDAYEQWKATYRKPQCPEVSAQNLVLLLHYLNNEPAKSDNKDLEECLKRQNSEFEVFWDSPSCILKALRHCILTRSWNSMTLLLLILLNYDKKYLYIVRNMCRIMLKFNPLIKECGLEDQFKILIEPSLGKNVV